MQRQKRLTTENTEEKTPLPKALIRALSMPLGTVENCSKRYCTTEYTESTEEKPALTKKPFSVDLCALCGKPLLPKVLHSALCVLCGKKLLTL